MPTPFETEAAKREQQPVYFARFEGIATKDYSTGQVLSPAVTKLICMQTPRGASQNLTPLQGRATTGEVELELLDVDAEITKIVSTEKSPPLVSTLINRKVTLFAGYQPLAEADYPAVFTGEIRDAELIGPLRYRFRISDFKRRYEELLMKSISSPVVTQVDAAAANGQNKVTVKSVSGIATSTAYLLFKKNGATWEQVTVTAINTSTRELTLSANLVNSYAAGDLFTRAARVRGNIVNVFYSLLTGTFTTSATAAYPLLDFKFSPEGLNLVDADLDLASFTRTRDRFLGSFDVDFFFNSPIAARTFFEQQLYPLGFYPTVRGDGKLGIRSFVPPGPEDDPPTKVHKEHMAGFPAWGRKLESHVNKIQVNGDHDLAASSFSQLALSDDTSDQSATREVRLYKVESKGLRSGLEGAAIAEEIAHRVKRRWLVPPIEVEVPLAFHKRTIEVGDIVSLSHPALPDNVAATLGLTDRLMEVTRVDTDFGAGKLMVTLLETGFKRFAWLGPATMADYPVATATERQYAYFGDAANKVNAGADDGYTIF